MAQGTPRTRRQVLRAAVAAAGGALAAQALGISDAAEAANGTTVQVGSSHSGTATTTIKNTSASRTAVAIKGVVTASSAGGSTVGVRGESATGHGAGVYGVATSTSSDAQGV